MSFIVLKHCTLWDGTSPEVREDMHVLVEGERIREISERSHHSADRHRSLTARARRSCRV